MRIVFMVLACICLFASGCLYSSTNGVFVKTDNATIVGPEGFIHLGPHSSALFARSMSTTSDKKKEFVGWPKNINIQQDVNGNLNMGETNKLMPKDNQSPDANNSSGIDQAINVAAAAVGAVK